MAYRGQGVSISPAVPQLLGLVPESLSARSLIKRTIGSAYSLLPWFAHVPVGFEKGPNVEGLTAPDVPMDTPVEG